MLQLKNKQALATDAHKLAGGHHLVRHRSITYVPADYETKDTSVTPDPDRTIWLPLSRRQIQLLAADQFDTLFGSDSELSSFEFMVAQYATQIDDAVTSLLVSTEQGLKELNSRGQLVDVTGDFRPNAIVPMLNTDKDSKARVFDTISEWLDSEEEARALLRHLATSLAPGWSSVKYLLLLGEGRNGKSLLLKMLKALFGTENVSNVTRQAIAEQSAVVTELNGKLLNIVFDGQAEYLKDSGAEKTLIAGETFPIRKLYESTVTPVQTNALFIEGLQQEPKTKDKSTALQKRLVRFQFPKVYPLDHRFERSMLTEGTLGAFLALLIDYYVTDDAVAELLAPTTKALELQLDQMYSNSKGLQFLKHVEENDPLGAAGLVGQDMHALVQQFQAWRLKENDIGSYNEPDVMALFQPLLATERKARRIDNQPRKVRVITSFKDEAAAFIDSLKGDTDAEILEALVDD